MYGAKTIFRLDAWARIIRSHLRFLSERPLVTFARGKRVGTSPLKKNRVDGVLFSSFHYLCLP